MRNVRHAALFGLLRAREQYKYVFRRTRLKGFPVLHANFYESFDLNNVQRVINSG